MSKAAERLLFLPGASGNTQFWQPVAARLNHPGERRFFGWPGYGGLPPDPNVNGLDDLVRLVASDITAPTALLAQSMGGVIATLAALEKLELVTHLVLAATSGGLDVRALGAQDWRPEFRRQHPRLPLFADSERWDVEPRLAEVQVPVLLLWGDADPISPVAVGERLRELLPRSELVVVPGGDHDLVMEKAEEIAPHVERHLGKPG